MKLKFKALSITLGLVALLGACTSVDSQTPESTSPDNSVEISPNVDEGVNNTELGTSEEIEDAAELEASEETEATDKSSIEGTIDGDGAVETKEEGVNSSAQ